MRRILKTILKKTGLDAPVKAYPNSWLGRKMAGVDRKLIKEHFAEQKIKKLNLGSGYHVLDGWLNADVFPPLKKVLKIDATKKYPFDDQTFDYIFSQHMIEHVSYAQGQQMLKECFRILKDGGKIRISTPDLLFLISLYQSEKSEQQKAYIKWSTQRCIEGAPICNDTFVINHFVRAWGHTFIYDEKVLRFALQEAGFKEIVKCNLNESEDPILRNLENEERIPAGFLRLESLVLEAKK